MADLRANALALRDLAELTGADRPTLDFAGVLLTFDTTDGFHLVPVEGEPVEITEWVEWTGLLPVEGVESVREQPVLLAGRQW